MRAKTVASGFCLAGVAAAAAVAGGKSPEPTQPIGLAVDLGEAPRKIFHARLSIPAKAGPLTLLYPKWIPGEHGPTGPIVDVAGLQVSAGGKPLSWRRDPGEMTAFRVEVPKGAAGIEVELDFLSAPSEEGFSSGASTSEKLAVLNWNQVLLYPAGQPADEILFVPSLKLPEGWTAASALEIERQTGREVVFRPVSLATLVDSPVIAGRHRRSEPLAPDSGLDHRLEIVADSAEALEIPDETLQAYHRLVREALALFGAHHYSRYRFLLTLSDQVARFGLEHHESSDNRSFERALLDPQKRLLMAGLLPHEFVHSWNGKYRRPKDLVTGGYDRPFRTELLWVYEGLTSYLGDVLAARSGLFTPEQFRENLAFDAAEMEHRAGRRWRPLVDTAVAAQLLYGARDQWRSWRRDVDFYAESGLIWLEADVSIREATGGARSLDDFCRAFFGGESGPARVVPYTEEDLLRALGQVAPLDWRRFFEERVHQVAPRAPLGGIERSGWRLAYTDQIPERLQAIEAVRKITDLTHSLGMILDDSGTIRDVVPGLPAAEAGIAPSMKLLGVNGRRFTKELLREAIRRPRSNPEPIELLVENGDFLKTFVLEDHGGERYPKLERIPDRPDLLSSIIAPRATAPEVSGSLPAPPGTGGGLKDRAAWGTSY